SSAYLFVAHGIGGRAARRCAASAAALRTADQPRRHRRHRPAPELGAAQCRARPHPNRLPGAGGLDPRKAGRRRRRPLELGQGGVGPIGARGLCRGAAPQPRPLLLEGAHLDRPGRNRLEPARPLEHGPAQLPRLERPGLGLYELYLNGQRVGDQVLAPGPTDYTQGVKYNTFDVTALLRPGANALGTVLGNGRFYAMRQNYKPYKIKTFGYPKLLMQLDVTYADGSHEVIKTDETWQATADGPIR
nr:hypothetical protein [Tanacetum cinerariifolium]